MHEGETATYTVVLDSVPSGNVTVTPSSDDADAAAVSGAPTFTPSNWNTPQTVTVTGVEENDGDVHDETATVSHAVSEETRLGRIGDLDYGFGNDRVILRDGRIMGLSYEHDSFARSLFGVTYTADGDRLSGEVRGTEYTCDPASFAVAAIHSIESRQLSDTVVEAGSTRLTVTDADGGKDRFSLHHDAVYYRPSSLSLWEGTWVVVRDGVSVDTMTVDADGGICRQHFRGCTTNGRLSVLDPDRNPYELEDDVANCRNLDGACAGFACPDPPGGSDNDRALLMAMRDSGPAVLARALSRPGALPAADAPEDDPEDRRGDARDRATAFDASPDAGGVLTAADADCFSIGPSVSGTLKVHPGRSNRRPGGSNLPTVRTSRSTTVRAPATTSPSRANPLAASTAIAYKALRAPPLATSPRMRAWARNSGGGTATRRLPRRGWLRRAAAPALAAVLAGPLCGVWSAAHGQNVLVSNLAHTSFDEIIVTTQPSPGFFDSVAQRFTTGNQAGAYALGSVQLELESPAATVAISVSIHTATEAGLPGTQRYALTSPASLADGVNTFAAPAGATLLPDTDYFVVVEKSSGDAQISRSVQFSEDPKAPGWSIFDNWHYRASPGADWQSGAGADRLLKIAVRSLHPAVAPSQPTTPTFVSATSTTLTLEWTHPSDGGALLNNSYVHYRIHGSGDEWTNWYVGNNAVTRATIGGLSPLTRYEVRVVTVNSVGSSPWSPTADGPQLMTTDNDPPVAAGTVADQTATPGTPFRFQVPAGTFTDAEDDPLSYDATRADGTALPTWLFFDPATRTFSGTPRAADAGTLSVKVTARDPSGGAADVTFAIEVSEPPPPPPPVLVANSETTNHINFFNRNYFAQSFVAASPFTLTSIALRFEDLAPNAAVAVSLHRPDATEPANPGAKVADLTLSGTLSTAADNTFTAPANTMLAAGTYFAQVRRTAGQSDLIRLARGTDAESRAEPRWRVADVSRHSTHGTSWSTFNSPFYLAVRGTASEASGDATLSALALSNPADDSAVALSPGFDPATTAYLASVAATVTEITVAPTASDGAATYEIQDGTGAAIDDANATETGHQVGLASGVNVIRVEVTAEDTTAEIYTVTVTRSAASCAAPDFGTRRQVWSGTVTVGQGTVRSTVRYGFNDGTPSFGALDDRTFSIGANDYTIDSIQAFGSGSDAGRLLFGVAASNLLTDQQVQHLQLQVCDGTPYRFNATDANVGTRLFAWDGSLDWSSTTSVTLHLSLPANRAATGKPDISGTAASGQTLTAGKNDVDDADTEPAAFPADYAFQWQRLVDSQWLPIPGATLQTYTLADEDAGHDVRVIATFTDALGTTETRGSDPVSVPALPAIGIEADRGSATGKLDWVRYTLTRGGDAAQPLTVEIEFEPPAGNDWNLPAEKLTREVTFGAGSDTVTEAVGLHGNFGGIGFSNSATRSGVLGARVKPIPRYDTGGAAEVQVVVTPGPAWVLSLGRSAYRFAEDGGAQTVELLATARSAAVPAPSLDNHNQSVLGASLVTAADTATSNADYTNLSGSYRFPASSCAPATGGLLKCTADATFTVLDDNEIEPEESLDFRLQAASGTPPVVHLRGPRGTPDPNAKDYPVTLVDDEFGVLEVNVTSTPRLFSTGAPAPDTYGAGEDIEFTVTMNNAATVTGGTPTLAFALGTATKNAGYASGSGTRELVFAYEVLAADADTDGIAWAAGTIALAGAAIGRADGVSATPDLGYDAQAAPLAGHKVDGSRSDSASPTVTSIERHDPPDSPTNADTLTWRVTFSEGVKNVDAADFEVNGAGASAAIAVAAVARAMARYDVTVSGGDLADLDGTVTLGFASAQDIADPGGNALTDTAPTGTNDNGYVLDNTAPSVTIAGVPASSTGPFTATFTFSEAVFGFALADIAVAGGSRSDFTGEDGDTVYTARIAPRDSGQVTVDVAADAARDAAGNPNTAAAQAATAFTGSNATLRGLALANAANSVAIPLNPAFAASALSYTATAPSTVTEVTVTATLTDSGAAIAWLDGDDMPLADADSTAPGFQAPLSAGANVLKVQVTSADANAMRTYTVTVTRSAMSCAAPDFGTRRQVWSGTVTVGQGTVRSTVRYGFNDGTPSFGALDDRTFSIGANDYTIDSIQAFGSGSDAGRLLFGVDPSNLLTDHQVQHLQLHLCDTTPYRFNATDANVGTRLFAWDGSLDWSSTTSVTLHLSLPANRAATGKPDISGTAASGQTLTAGKNDVDDADTEPAAFPADYAFQWQRLVDSQWTPIPGATLQTYTLTGDDIGHDVRVIVTFTDAFGASESRSSDPVSVANNAPTLDNAIADQTAAVGTAFSFAFDANTFGDADAGDMLTYTATQEDGTALPGWLSFDPGTRTFSGTPQTGDIGTVSVKVTATDTAGATAEDTFDIAVSVAPLVSNRGKAGDDSPQANRAAQAFTTGANASGYTLTGITLHGSVFADSNGNTATLHSGSRTGTKVADFTAAVSGNFALVLTPTSATTLESGTTYFLVTANDFGSGLWNTTASDDEDATPAPGWSIADDSEIFFTTTMAWGPINSSRLLTVNGYANAGSGTNNAPTLDNAISDQTATTGTAFSFAFDANTFGDADAGDTLTYTATQQDGTALPGWLSFDPGTRTFSGTPQAADIGTVSVTVTATDDADATAEDTFDIVVVSAADADATLSALALTNAADDSAIALTPAFAADTTAYHARVDTSVTQVTVAPATNNPAATFVIQDASDMDIDDDTTKPGVQAALAIGDNLIKVKVTSADTTTTQTYTVTVTRGENDPPTVDNPIPDQSGTEGSAFNFTFAANTFSDPDGDDLDYRATLDGAELPDWLNFDSATRTFASDRLPDAAVGTRNVAVTADDRLDTATDEFNLVVTESCAAPVFDGRTPVWRATLTVGERTLAPAYWGFNADDSVGSLNGTSFQLGLTNFIVNRFTTSHAAGGTWTFDVSGNNSMIAGQARQLRMHVCDRDLDLNLTDEIGSSNPEDLIGGFGEDQTDRFDWSRVRFRTVALSKPANRPAAGLPAIGGALFVGRTLTADTSAIADPDGLHLIGLGINAFEYQWIRVRDGVETDIPGETGETYLLTAEDENYQIRLRVTFRDDLHVPGQQPETRTSEVRPRSGAVSVSTGGDAPPTGVTGIEVNGDRLTIAFAEDLDPASDPPAGDFTVREAKPDSLFSGTELTVSAVRTGASSVTLTLAAPVVAEDGDLRLDYAPSGAPIRFADGTELGAFRDATVANVTPYPADDPDTLPPVLRDERPKVVGDTLTLLFNEQLDTNSVPKPEDFEVRGAAGARIDVVDVSVGGAGVTLILARPVEAGESVTLSYSFSESSGGSGVPVRDTAGNAHWGAGLLNVSNRTVVPPSATGTGGTTTDPQMTAQVNGATLTLGFDRDLAPGVSPPKGDFTVKNTTTSRFFGTVTVLLRVNAVFASGRTVTLSLGSGPGAGEEVRLDYAPSGSPIRFADGSKLDAFANVAVTNVTADAAASQPWLLGIRVEDAAAKEGPGATLEFTVRLDRAHREDITVDYATADITATAGEDYDATRGTLRIPAGQTRAVIQVPLREDYHNDNGETLLLTLSNPSAGRLAEATPAGNGTPIWRPQWDTLLDGNGTPIGGDGTAIGTIENADPMPGAWLSRFGRAASDNAVEAIARRWEPGPAQPRETHFTLGGQRVGSMFERVAGALDGPARGGRPDPALEDPDPSGPAPSLRREGDPTRPARTPGHAPGAPRPAAPQRGTPGASAPDGPDGTAPGDAASSAGGWTEVLDTFAVAAGDARWARLYRQGRSLLDGARRLELRDVLMNSSFQYSPGAAGNDGTDSPHRGWLGDWSAWGESSATRFGGTEGPLSLDGEVATALVGFDSRRGPLLAGVALSYTEGAGSYTAQQGGGGSLTSALTSLHPYAHYRFSERLSAWGVLGYGAGDLALTPHDAGPIETGLTHAHAALGARAALSMHAGEAGRFELALRSDARYARTASGAVTGLSGAEGATSRVRLMLEGTGSVSLASGAVLTPTLEAGLRYDGGDAETGAGLELGAGLAYASGPFEIRVDARALAAHEDEAYEEWGFSGSVVYRPSSDGRGLSLNLGSSWGRVESGVQALWSRADAAGLAGGASPWQPGRRLQADLGYGLQGRNGRALWTPYLGADAGAGPGALRFGFTRASGSDIRTSLEFRVPQRTRHAIPAADPAISTRPGDAAPAHPSLALDWSLRW